MAGKEGVPAPVDQEGPYARVPGPEDVLQVHVSDVCSIGRFHAGLPERMFKDAAVRLLRANNGRNHGKIEVLQETHFLQKTDQVGSCIRENPDTRAVKVLAITAFPEQDTIKKMYDAGADLCLIKPLQFDHFRLEVVRLLNEAEGPHAATG